MSHALVLVVATGIVFAAAVILVRAFGVTDVLDQFVAASVLAATQIVVCVLFAGLVLRRLEISVVLVTTAVVSAGFVAGSRRRAPIERTRLFAAFRVQPLAASLTIAAGVGIGLRTLLALVLPPYGYDALSYHLPTVVDWLQAGRIAKGPLNTCCAYYPQIGEVLMTWPALLADRMKLVDLMQIAAALVGAVAVAGIARVAHLSPVGAWMAASLFLLTPILLAQVNTAYVDVLFTSAALASIYLILRFFETPTPKRWLFLGCAGAASALCIGTKPTGAAFGVALLLPLVVTAIARRPYSWREVGLVAALFALPIGLLGISWYVRSWTATGNPFFPMNVKFLSITIFSGTNHLGGPPPRIARHSALVRPFVSWYSDIHFWTRSGYGFADRIGGLGPLWSYLGAILVVVFAVHTWLRRRAIFWYFLMPLLMFFVLQPQNALSRYTLPLAAAGSVAVAWATTESWRPTIARMALVIAAFGLAIAGAVVASKEILPGGERLALSYILGDVARGRQPVRGTFDREYEWVIAAKAGSRIGIDVATVHVTAPLAGSRFQNVLVAIPAHGKLRAVVAAERLDYVVTRRNSDYDRQAAHDGGRLTSLGGSRVRTYRVRRT
jgi:Dolichyl-phosphate-mannose-protein mannosyltransferase